MNKILIIALLFISSLSAQQYYYTFYELKGMEDQSNNTHLFYRLYTFQYGGPIVGDYYENSIYHFDLFNQTDTLFLFEGGRIGESTTGIVDLEFWDNNPATYIYLGVGTSVDQVAFIKRFDQEQPSYNQLGEALSLELGKQNDSLVIATAPTTIKSTDGGFNWTQFSTSYSKILSITPYNDDVMFFNDGGFLGKTTDGGQNINVVDTNHNSTGLFYDKDSLHIFSLVNNRLKVSNNRGNAFSWSEKYLQH